MKYCHVVIFKQQHLRCHEIEVHAVLLSLDTLVSFYSMHNCLAILDIKDNRPLNHQFNSLSVYWYCHFHGAMPVRILAFMHIEMKLFLLMSSTDSRLWWYDRYSTFNPSIVWLVYDVILNEACKTYFITRFLHYLMRFCIVSFVILTQGLFLIYL